MVISTSKEILTVRSEQKLRCYSYTSVVLFMRTGIIA
jgi:hypothetical protein